MSSRNVPGFKSSSCSGPLLFGRGTLSAGMRFTHIALGVFFIYIFPGPFSLRLSGGEG